jgi:hypothetical protein
MAVSGFFSPFMGSVTATVTAQSVWTLLQAVFTNLPHKCCWLQIQVDPGAGGTGVYIGNSNDAAIMNGASILATQGTQVFAFDSNLIVLDHIFLVASTGTAQVNLIVMVR